MVNHLKTEGREAKGGFSRVFQGLSKRDEPFSLSNPALGLSPGSGGTTGAATPDPAWRNGQGGPLLYLRSRTSQSPRVYEHAHWSPATSRDGGVGRAVAPAQASHSSVLPGAQQMLLPNQLPCVKEEESGLLRAWPENPLP